MKDLTQGNIYKVFIFFAIPLVLSGLLSQAYGVINTMIAGKFLGEDGIAAIGSTNSFTELISSVFWGFSADRKSTRLNSSHSDRSRMPSSA